MKEFFNIQIDRRPAAIVVDIHPQQDSRLISNDVEIVQK